MNIILGIVAILAAFIVFVACKEANKPKILPQKCSCDKSESGYCDNSHETNS